MRFLTSAVAAAALLAFQVTPVLSQTTTQEPTPPAAAPAAPAPAPAPAQAAPAPETTAPAGTQAPAPTQHRAAKRHAKRTTLHDRFQAANTAKDGHLTADEAKAAKWTYVERHFDAMDKDHKGYVTEADIHAYAHAQYLARHAAKAAQPSGAAPAAPAPAAPAPAAPAPAAPAQQ